MRHALIGAALGVFIIAAPAFAADEKMSADKFVEKAAQSSMAEIQMGKMASENAKSDQVKRFGERMVKDHGQASQQLSQAAQGKHKMPTEIDSAHKQKVQKMSGMTGDEFDRAYMQDMLAEHKKDVELFQGYAQNGDDAQLKSFAQSTLPILQEHLKMAQDITGGEKAETPSGSSSSSSSGTTR